MEMSGLEVIAAAVMRFCFVHALWVDAGLVCKCLLCDTIGRYDFLCGRCLSMDASDQSTAC